MLYGWLWAAEMEDQIPEEIKEERRDIIMAMQQEIAFENNESWIGEEMDVMIEGYLPDDDIYVGRSYMDAPDVDGFVFLSTSWHLETGDYVRARIVQAQGYDLIGEVIEEEDEDELTK
jgi:ribosomal protein S12 methylthiotransferase